jgi:hypothetical protein
LSTDDRLVYELAARGLNNSQIGEATGVDEATVRRSLKRTGFAKHLIPTDLDERFKLNVDEPLVLTNQDAMITADWHIPIYNPHLVNEMIERARDEQINQLVVGGDWFNFDSLSHYDPKQEDAGLEREIEESQHVMRILAETFEDIYFIWGNHDARMHKALGYKIKFANAMRLLFGELGKDVNRKLHISNLDHLWMEYPDAAPNKRRWRVCHPATYSRVPLSTPRVLASKYNANVICAHAHHAAVGFATDGIRTVAEAGGLFNQHKTSYLQRSTTFPVWTPGYGWIKDGKYQMTTPAWGTQ